MEKNKTTYTAPSTETIVMDLTGALNAGVSGGGNQVETSGAQKGSGVGAGGAHTKEYVLEDVDLWSNEEEEEE